MARRSTSRSIKEPTLVVGVIRGAHGVRGEIRVTPDTDNRERFTRGRRVLVAGLGEREILAVRGTRAEPIVRLQGVLDREAAKALRGKELRVPLADARAEARGYLWADLVGMRVEDEAGSPLGTLVEVLRTGGESDVFVIRDRRGAEVLLPAVDSVVLRIEVGERRMVVRPQEEA